MAGQEYSAVENSLKQMVTLDGKFSHLVVYMVLVLPKKWTKVDAAFRFTGDIYRQLTYTRKRTTLLVRFQPYQPSRLAKHRSKENLQVQCATPTGSNVIQTMGTNTSSDPPNEDYFCQKTKPGLGQRMPERSIVLGQPQSQERLTRCSSLAPNNPKIFQSLYKSIEQSLGSKSPRIWQFARDYHMVHQKDKVGAFRQGTNHLKHPKFHSLIWESVKVTLFSIQLTFRFGQKPHQMEV